MRQAAVTSLRDAGAMFAFVHGSRASGAARPDSDLDVAAWWTADPPQRFEVLLPAGVDLLVLNSAPLELAGRVAVDGELLFDDDPAAGCTGWPRPARSTSTNGPASSAAIVSSPRVSAVVDETRVLRLLRALADDLAVLRTAALAGPDRQADPLWLRGVKYTFVTAIESCVDVAQHLCASEGWGPPSDNGDAFNLLGRHGVLERSLAGRMRQAAGFGNVLVHEYVRVDDQVVMDRLHDPSDLEHFARQVADWLAANVD